MAFTYDQSLAPGPPWSIDDALVHELYAPPAAPRGRGRGIETLETRDASISRRLAAAGVKSIRESAYLIT